jgi:riboflavin synthase
MFTGIVENTGTVVAVTPTGGATRLTIAAPTLASKLTIGESMAVCGVCLTAVDLQGDNFFADLAAETIARTTLAALRPGSLVNLERPTLAGTPLGGHIVQGHVDGVGTLLAVEPLSPDLATTDWRLRLRIPQEITRYVAPQGSIAIEGMSLTVASIQGDVVEIAIIPHTYTATNLHALKPGDGLNIEVDMLAKYAEKLFIERKQGEARLTLQQFIAKGY